MNKSVIKEFRNDYLDEHYYKINHKSGLSVYVFPKERISSWAILGTEYGSVDNSIYDEKSGKYKSLPNGIAHFLEHKMFDNEDNVCVDDIFSELGGDPNACTSWEQTMYLFSTSENYYKCLRELVKFVTIPYFTDESIAKEQGIIDQEIAMADDDPYIACFNNMVKGLYKTNPVRIEIAGTQASIKEITPEMLYACHKEFYHPSNLALVACGNVDVDNVLQVLDEELKNFSPKNPHKRDILGNDNDIYNSEISKNMQIERPIFTFGFKDNKRFADKFERRKREIISEIVSGTLFNSSCEFYTSLYKNGLITNPFNYGGEYGETYSFCYLGGECDDIDAVKEELLKFMAEIKENGINASDFERRKNVIYASEIKMYDSTFDIANALFSNHSVDICLFDDIEIIKSITLDEANDFAKEIFVKENLTCSKILPLDK